MIGLIFDLAEMLFSVIAVAATASGNRKTLRKNDAAFNFLVNLAWADKNLHDEERKFLQKILNEFSFKDYIKDVDASVQKAKERPLSIEEVIKIWSKGKKDEQKTIVKLAMLLTVKDANVSPAESAMVLKLAHGLRFTDSEYKQLVNEVFPQGKEKPSNPK